MKAILILLLSALLAPCSSLFSQSSAAKRQIIVDVAHGQRFYNDPATNTANGIASAERIKYMTGEITKNATALNASVRYQTSPFSAGDLAGCDLLFIHIPSAKYSEAEVSAIRRYLKKGGSLFVVMDEDGWSTLSQTNVNDLISPYGLVFKSDDPDDKTSGGYTKPGPVTDKKLSIPYHGARSIAGGTPFCFSKPGADHPFGMYKEIRNGGRIIAMGDGMVSLYMTQWQDVSNYQCAEFMQDAFAWLLK
jgi:hypothetical protein